MTRSKITIKSKIRFRDCWSIGSRLTDCNETMMQKLDSNIIKYKTDKLINYTRFTETIDNVRPMTTFSLTY